MLLTGKISKWTTRITLGCVLAVLSPAIPSNAADTEGTIGPDIVTYRVYEPTLWGTDGGIAAYSVGTESCNRGDEHAAWISGTPEHPVIAQNLYRLKDGRLEQIGMSWLKHGFYSLNENNCGGNCQSCYPCNPSLLCVGCSDPYTASLNGNQSLLGPRHEVNPYNGDFPYPPHSSPVGHSTLKGRLQVATADVHPASNPGARFFAEGQYVTADEAAAGNSENSASYREESISAALQMTDLGSTFESVPAIYAWEAADPSVMTVEARVPNEGLFIAASVARDNGGGSWRYEYAVYNLNSHRSAQSFAVPILTDAQITNTGFHDVDYHSGEPYDGTLPPTPTPTPCAGGPCTTSGSTPTGSPNRARRPSASSCRGLRILSKRWSQRLLPTR